MTSQWKGGGRRLRKGEPRSTTESAASSNRKVRFQLPRSKSYGEDEDDDDDVSMLELASMDLTPRVDPRARGPRVFVQKEGQTRRR
jgi:hypothetical protein